MTKKSNNKLSILIVLIILLIALAVVSRLNDDAIEDPLLDAGISSDTFYLPVIETTDIHGYMIDISSGIEDSYQYRLAYIANEIDTLRKEGDILLLDTGDCYQGNVLSNKLDGSLVRAYLDTMDYDAICLGNHEFDWGLEKVLDPDGTIASYEVGDSLCDGGNTAGSDSNVNTSGNYGNFISGDGDTPVVCWNIYFKDSGKKIPQTQDYVIVDKLAKSPSGETLPVKVAIFGYINDYSSSINKPLIEDYEIHEEDIKDIESTARELEGSGKTDISVINCHIPPEEMNELFKGDSVIDLVACGHSHKKDTGIFDNGVPYILGGCYAGTYATATIAIGSNHEVTVDNQSLVSVTQKRSKLYDTPENQSFLNKTILDISHAAINEVNEKFPTIMQQLGYIDTNISQDRLDGSIREDIATTWAASMMANAVGADVGITNSTGIRCGFELQKGESLHYITGADIYTMFPFSNYIMKYQISYEHLYKICTKTRVNDHTYLGISNVTAYYEDGNDNKLTTLYVGDVKVYDNGWVKSKDTPVTVATNDYLSHFDSLGLENLTPINDYKNVIDNACIIDYLSTNYGPSQKIPVDTSVHLHNSVE